MKQIIKSKFTEQCENSGVNGVFASSDWYLLDDGTVIQDGSNTQGQKWTRRFKNIDEINTEIRNQIIVGNMIDVENCSEYYDEQIL